MIFPHLILCKTKLESDSSNSETTARRLKQWHKGELNKMEKRCKCTWQKKRKKEETEAQQIKKLMSTGKKSSAIAELTDTSKGVLSLGETVKVQTVEQIIIEKNPPAEPLNSNYITPCSQDKSLFHSSTFE